MSMQTSRRGRARERQTGRPGCTPSPSASGAEPPRATRMWLGLVVCGWCWRIQRNGMEVREGHWAVGCQYCGWLSGYYILH